MTEFKLGLPVVLVVAFITWLWPPIIGVIFFLALGAVAFYAVCRATGFFLLLFLQWYTGENSDVSGGPPNPRPTPVSRHGRGRPGSMRAGAMSVKPEKPTEPPNVPPPIPPPNEWRKG